MHPLPQNTLERIIPDLLATGETTGRDTLALHVARYEYAAKFAYGYVLDAACGVGYGSALLAKAARIDTVVGIDMEERAIAYAKEKYNAPNISYLATDVYLYKPTVFFDCIVSLETIEHLPDPEGCIRHFYKLLRPGGMLIASVPITPSMDANPHHLTDFSAKLFIQCLEYAGFVIEDQYLQIQSYNPFKLWRGKEQRGKNIRSGLLRWYWRHPDKFWLRITSLLSHGFQNRYLTVKAKKQGA
ncbi:class I SAM-dependent methyltransferase [Lewinella sp. LCG006]|uniref:class I SAM-dependent methyltransferase n=1 Tax=Lewinella sp. LCG006 TaxID=3231911 RepID=UPI00345F494E